MSHPFRSLTFIVGCPRSGTTLLRNILNAHSDISIARETHFFPRIWAGRGLVGSLDREETFQKVLGDCSPLRHHTTGKDGWFPPSLRADYQAFRERYAPHPSLFLSLMQASKGSGKTVLGEKTPLHLFFAEQINSFYPRMQPTFLCLVRDPRAVVASAVQRWGSRPQAHIGYALMWARCLQKAEACMQRVGGGRFLLIRYEDLVLDTENTLRGICLALNVPFEPSMVRVEQSNTSYAGAPSTGVTDGSLHRWKEVLSPRQVADVDWLTRSHLASYGYEQGGGSSLSGARKGCLALQRQTVAVRHQAYMTLARRGLVPSFLK